MSNQVLIILHQATSTPGRIGTLLKSRGYNLIIKRPALGDKLPDTLEGDYAAAIMFGGPMSANDKDDFIQMTVYLENDLSINNYNEQSVA